MNHAEKSAQARAAIEAIHAKGGRKLGSIQQGVLKALIEHGNYPGGWVWDTRANTIKVLDTLVARGAVEFVERPLTDHLGRRFPEGHPYHTATQKHYKPAAWLLDVEVPA